MVVATSRQITVLLVEDDDLLRDAFTRNLVKHGYLALTAPTGHDAIGLIRTLSTPIDLVILDVGLPDVSGADLCARFRDFYPDVPVVVCSGGANEDELMGLKSLGVDLFFAKPVSVEELLNAVRETLSGRT